MKRPGGPPFVCLITEGKINTENYIAERSAMIEKALEAVADGVSMIQIREKTLSGRLLFDLASSVVEALNKTPILVFVNDRADVAAAAGADGVHLPENSMPPDAVRKSFHDLLIGVSTHTLETAKTAAAGGADYVFFGPVFDTPGKGDPVGVDVLRQVSRELGGVPTIALGGIDEKNFDAVVSAGAAGIAAIRALNDAGSRQLICRGIRCRAVG